MRPIAAKFVPRLLTDDQKQHRLEVCMELKEQVRSDPDFLSKVVTGDESWIYVYDPIVPVEVSIFTPAEERAASEKQREDNVDLLFRY
jgi:hypothetical protein